MMPMTGSNRERRAEARERDERHLEEWLAFARVDAERRGLPELKPLLGGLFAAVRELRNADWNDDFAAKPGVKTAP